MLKMKSANKKNQTPKNTYKTFKEKQAERRAKAATLVQKTAATERTNAEKRRPRRVYYAVHYKYSGKDEFGKKISGEALIVVEMIKPLGRDNIRQFKSIIKRKSDRDTGMNTNVVPDFWYQLRDYRD